MTKPAVPPPIRELVRLASITEEEEFDCGQFQQHAAEYAERHLRGLSPTEAIAKVEHHLSVCPECREELEALLVVLREADEG